ncbi:MAG: MerR family transcriptional regulator [Bdellovibrionales bacterium]|nr:MerR family transcriptional regulator [Bdellovibrionales bacterium]
MVDMDGSNGQEIHLNSEEVQRRYAPSSDRMVAPVQVDESLAQELKKIPEKMAFKIGEVADLLKVKPYVLRYWESEFDFLKPKKSAHNQRMYSRKDVETLFLLKKLLYVDRFSIEGARSAMKRLKKDHKRFKQIRSVKEHVDEAKDLLLDVLDDIADFKFMLK